MAMLTVRNIPDELLGALHLRASQRGHSLETEVREILQSALGPQRQVKLGSLLAEVGRQAALSDEEFAVFEGSALATPGRLDGSAFDRDEANARGA